MKTRFIVAFLFSICFSGIVKAQGVFYTPYEKFDFRTGDYSVIGKVGGLLYTYHGSPEGYYLDAYNDSLLKVATVVLDFFPSRIYQVKWIAYADHIIVLYQSLDGTKLTQYAALLDNNGRLKKGPLQLENTRTSFFGALKVYYSAAVSEDKKSILVYSADDKGQNLTFDGKWIDDQLNIVSKTHAVLKADNDLSHGDAILANNGNLYLPVYTPIGSKNYADQVFLASLHPGDTKFSFLEFPLNQQFASGAYVKADNANNRIYLGGFYAGKKNGSYEGVIYGYYDIATNTFSNKKSIPFDAQLLNATGEHNKKRAFDNFQVRQLIVKNDGGFVLIAEDFFMDTRSNYAPGFGYYSWYYGPLNTVVREYHYGDIMALSYDGKGNREWDSFIYKDQYSQEDAGLFSSYVLLNTGGTIGFLYNDFNTNNSRIQLATIDGQGKVAMNSLNAEGNGAPDWLPRQGKQVSARELVVPCLHRKQICFAKVVF